MPKDLHETSTDKNVAMATESFLKMVRMNDLLSARLRSLIEFPDVQSQTVIRHLHLLS